MRTSVEIIHCAVSSPQRVGSPVEIKVDRRTLAKLRWLGRAEDGTEFGFDLTKPMRDSEILHETSSHFYLIRQLPESVLEIRLGAPPAAAQTGWLLGNLHFQIEVDKEVIRVVDDPAVRQALDRDHIHYHSLMKVFHPLKTVAHQHRSAHSHDHSSSHSHH